MKKDKKQQDQYPKLTKEDQQWKNQDEFDDKSREKKAEAERKNSSLNQKYEDSQDGNERMIPDTSRKQSEKEYRTDRKLPNIKK